MQDGGLYVSSQRGGRKDDLQCCKQGYKVKVWGRVKLGWKNADIMIHFSSRPTICHNHIVVVFELSTMWSIHDYK